MHALTKYGPLTAIALFLVWWLAADVSGGVRDVRDLLRHHIGETNHYLRQICLNVAGDESERAGCILPMTQSTP